MKLAILFLTISVSFGAISFRETSTKASDGVYYNRTNNNVKPNDLNQVFNNLGADDVEVDTSIKANFATSNQFGYFDNNFKLRPFSVFVTPQMFGAYANGTTNDASYIQEAINYAVSNRVELRFDGTYYTGALTNPPGNLNITFTAGTTISADTNSISVASNGRIFNILQNGDVSFIGYGATIQMTKAHYTSEFNHAFNFENTTGNYLVEGLTIKDTGGDAIHIGANNGHLVTRNLKIQNCRRNGLSIIGVGSYSDYNSVFDGQTGTSPSDGIDIEPDVNTAVLGPISFNNSRFINNDGSGAMVFLGNWNLSNNFANISFISCISSNNGKAVVGGNRESGFDVRRIKDVGFSPAQGQILFDGCISVNDNNSGFRIRDVSSSGALTRIVDCQIINCNRDGISSTDNCPIIVASTGTTYTTAPGNVEIIRPKIIDDGTLLAQSLAAIEIYTPDTNSIPQKVHIENPSFINVSDRYFFVNHAKGITFNVTDPEIVHNTADASVLPRNLPEILSNSGASGLVIYTLPAASLASDSDTYNFIITTAQEMRIAVASGDSIVWNGQTCSYLSSSWTGSILTIQRRGSSSWKVINISGTWGADEAGGGYGPIATKINTYTATVRDRSLLCDTTSSGFTVTLPTPSEARGLEFSVKKISSDSNTLTVAVNGGFNIDTGLTKTTTGQNYGWIFVSNGSQYYVKSVVNNVELTDGDKGDIIVSSSGASWTIDNSGVSAGVYGNANYIPQITVNAKGLVTLITTNAWSLGNSGVTAGVYGNTLYIPQITVNVQGLVTSVTTNKVTFTNDLTIPITGTISAITTGVAKQTWYATYAATIKDIRITVASSTTTGTLTINIKKNGTTIFSTKPTIDATESSSRTAATAYVLSTTTCAAEDKFTFDVDGQGDGTAVNLQVTLFLQPI